MNDDKRLSQMEAELKERFREAFDDYLKENGEEIPDPDLSFLNKPREKKRHSHIYRFATVAACVALIFVTSSSMAVWMNSEAAHAMKFNLEKTFHKITNGFFSVEEENKESQDDRIVITIDNMEDIDDAIAFMPNLLIPQYIPDGFELDSLNISKFVSGSYTVVEYSFKNSSGLEYIIDSRFTKEEEDTIGLIGQSEVIELDDRTLYFIQDNYTANCSLSFIFANQFINITGEIDRELMIKIAEQIQLSK